MKHVFLVHSPITYLVSVSIIQELKILREDAIIFFQDFDKVIPPNNNYISISVNNFFVKQKSFKKLYNYIRYFNIATRVDKIINATLNNEKFIAYVPALAFINKALVTHHNCCSFNFIEEGLGQYYKEETLESLSIINSKDAWRSSNTKGIKTVLNEMYLVLRGYNFKLQSLPFSYSCYNAFTNVFYYGVTPEAFPLVDDEKKIIIPFNKKSFSIINPQSDIHLNDKFIWIGDGSVIGHSFNRQLYIQGIKEGCISFLKAKGIKEIMIKFHRLEPVSLRETIQQLFKDNGILFKVIPDNVIMELQLFEAKNVTLIGIYSSLLYYAGIMGHHSFSIYEYVQKEYSKTLKNRDFTFYWNKVKLIKKDVTN